ncbi:helix-hairpin-helix domain-containing protein [Arthrobacter sp. NPDC092385]|uniref:helix-hairpin-helix domain-containing protein n=1 Tax=Arthrobacter sp. NPDC092385 TaxID=3363943 RepID=UPI0038052BCA
MRVHPGLGTDPRRRLVGHDATGEGPPGGSPAAGAGGGGVQWRIARSAALVWLGVALAVGAALFLVRSSEPSAAAVSVQLDAPASAPAEGGAAQGDRSGPAGEGSDDASRDGSGSGSSGGGPPGSAGDGAVPPAAGQADAASGRSSAEDASAAPDPGRDGGLVVVYLTGAVVSPGVLTVPAGTRLFEIIEKAGGALPEADLEGINLAATPSDGLHIHLLAVGEEPRPGMVPDASPVPGGQAPGGDGGAAGGSGGTAGAIDINTATLSDIESLPRVGPVLGQRIIDWREKHGPFAQTADIDAVPGIGPAMLEAILPLIVVR